MPQIIKEELKRLFVSSMKRAYDFSYEGSNPFMMTLGEQRFFVFLKNISPAYFKNRPDVTRVQLPASEHYKKILKSDIPFIILGYDAENDVFVNWNPDEIKQRLNSKNNVSLYSRRSIQESVKGKEFKEEVLNTGGKFILFKRHLIVDFFRDLKNLYDFETEEEYIEEEVSENKITEITDKALIKQITPLLKNNRVLEAATICYNHYNKKYSGMKIKDWLNIANEMYQRLGT